MFNYSSSITTLRINSQSLTSFPVFRLGISGFVSEINCLVSISRLFCLHLVIVSCVPLFGECIFEVCSRLHCLVFFSGAANTSSNSHVGRTIVLHVQRGCSLCYKFPLAFILKQGKVIMSDESSIFLLSNAQSNALVRKSLYSDRVTHH